MNKIKNSQLKPKLNAYEQEIEDNLDTSKLLTGEKKRLEMAKLTMAAKQHVHKRIKEKRISIRVFAGDLDRLKEIAEEEGLPYQTLVTSILHKFTTGRLVAKNK